MYHDIKDWPFRKVYHVYVSEQCIILYNKERPIDMRMIFLSVQDCSLFIYIANNVRNIATYINLSCHNIIVSSREKNRTGEMHGT
jgi:hypothetical protein